MTDWTVIQTQADIELLEQEICGFHDSCIVGIDYKTGTFVNKDRSMHVGWQPEDYTLLLSLGTPYSYCAMELLFSGVRRVHIAGMERNYDPTILSGYVAFHDHVLPDDPRRLIIWSDYDWFEPSKLGEYAMAGASNAITYIIAEGLKWRWREW